MPGWPGQFLTVPVARRLLHHGDHFQRRPVWQARWASLEHRVLPVQLVSALPVDIQQGKLGLAAHLSCLVGQAVKVRNLFHDSDDLGDQVRSDDS